MRKMLRYFLAWMDRRFPERVVVTQTEFVALKAKIDALPNPAISEDRLRKIEQEINKFNVSMGFAGTLPKGIAAQFQR